MRGRREKVPEGKHMPGFRQGRPSLHPKPSDQPHLEPHLLNPYTGHCASLRRLLGPAEVLFTSAPLQVQRSLPRRLLSLQEPPVSPRVLGTKSGAALFTRLFAGFVAASPPGS